LDGENNRQSLAQSELSSIIPGTVTIGFGESPTATTTALVLERPSIIKKTESNLKLTNPANIDTQIIFTPEKPSPEKVLQEPIKQTILMPIPCEKTKPRVIPLMSLGLRNTNKSPTKEYVDQKLKEKREKRKFLRGSVYSERPLPQRAKRQVFRKATYNEDYLENMHENNDEIIPKQKYEKQSKNKCEVFWKHSFDKFTHKIWKQLEKYEENIENAKNVFLE